MEAVLEGAGYFGGGHYQQEGNWDTVRCGVIEHRRFWVVGWWESPEFWGDTDFDASMEKSNVVCSCGHSL